jgi:hypothetical protein
MMLTGKKVCEDLSLSILCRYHASICDSPSAFFCIILLKIYSYYHHCYCHYHHHHHRSSAKDTIRNRKIAIKKIPKAFDDIVDAKRILREVKLLHHFNHENIVRLRDLVPPPDKTPFEDIYMVLDYMVRVV